MASGSGKLVADVERPSYLTGSNEEQTCLVLDSVELAAIAWIRNRYMETPLTSAGLQVVFGGLLVFAAGILIGSS